MLKEVAVSLVVSGVTATLARLPDVLSLLEQSVSLKGDWLIYRNETSVDRIGRARIFQFGNRVRVVFELEKDRKTLTYLLYGFVRGQSAQATFVEKGRRMYCGATCFRILPSEKEMVVRSLFLSHDETREWKTEDFFLKKSEVKIRV